MSDDAPASVESRDRTDPDADEQRRQIACALRVLRTGANVLVQLAGTPGADDDRGRTSESVQAAMLAASRYIRVRLGAKS